MAIEPIVVTESERTWETWPPEQLAQRGAVWWKTFISADLTASNALTLGVARVPSGEQLRLHRHEQPEVYLILDGSGVVAGARSSREVSAGDAVFLPGDAPHSIPAAVPGSCG